MTKVTAKKAVAKKAVGRPREKKTVPVDAIVLKDNILWAVVERKFLSANVVGIYNSRDEAEQEATILDLHSGLTFNKYVVQRAELHVA